MSERETHAGFILQPSYRMRDGRPVVMLFGRLQDDSAFLVEDTRFLPYCFVARRAEAALRGEQDATVEETDLRDLRGNPVSRIVVPFPAAVPPLREKLARAGVEALEADVRFPYRYLIDHDIRSGVEIEGAWTPLRPRLRRFYNPTLRPARVQPSLRVLSLDIETSPDGSRIFSVALVGCGAEEVHLVGRRSVSGADVHASERELLLALGDRLATLDPDVLLGWNVVDFDLRVLVRQAEQLGLLLPLGRIEGDVAFRQDRSFSLQTRAEIPGRVVLDGIPLVRDALRLEDYRLETVARAVLGRGKRIDSEAPDAAAEILRLYREDPEALVAYNLEDARLAIEILEREGLLDLAVERSSLSGMPLDRVGASIASFDRVYLPELRRAGFVAPSVDPGRKAELVRGGALLDPKPGVFANVAVFDFKSLYPSLIRTFNLDPLGHARAGEDAIRAPNGARFSRRASILPRVIEDYMARREEAKRRADRHADQAIKIMMNALFGVLGSAACRFFDAEVANAITTFGQQTLAWTRDAFEEEGVQVLYGDTDSVFVKLRTEAPGEPARAEAEELRRRVEGGIAARIRREYDVEPRLSLELEGVLDRFFLPRVRGGRGGSKKRYAGWLREPDSTGGEGAPTPAPQTPGTPTAPCGPCGAGRLRIVGLESVRRDWPRVARRLQEGMLTRLFTDREVLPFVKEVVDQTRGGELDHELVYVKRIRKGSLDRYTATTPPHIQAARKAGRHAGGIIHYVMTHNGPEPVLPGRPLPTGIDHAHYVERVIRPVADAILLELGRSFEEALGRPRQLELL